MSASDWPRFRVLSEPSAELLTNDAKRLETLGWIALGGPCEAQTWGGVEKKLWVQTMYMNKPRYLEAGDHPKPVA
jgi:hypothetical protein